ncbi:MetQ/NlpA family ABC transporter substrate-binding protein, partial [Mammaliicoccus sciuri]
AKDALKEDTKDGEIVVDLKQDEIKEIVDSLK